MELTFNTKVAHSAHLFKMYVIKLKIKMVMLLPPQKVTVISTEKHCKKSSETVI